MLWVWNSLAVPLFYPYNMHSRIEFLILISMIVFEVTRDFSCKIFALKLDRTWFRDVCPLKPSFYPIYEMFSFIQNWIWKPLSCELFVIYIGMNICELELKRTFSFVSWQVTPYQSTFLVWVPVYVERIEFTTGIKSNIDWTFTSVCIN